MSIFGVQADFPEKNAPPGSENVIHLHPFYRQCRQKKKEGDEPVLQRHQAIWIFPVWSLDLGLFIVKYNHCPAPQICWQQQVQADSFSVANYHPRKVDIHCSDITRWCHALICIWIKLLNRSRINRGRAQQQALSHFSHWLTLPHSAWAVRLRVHYGDRRSAMHGEALWSDLFGWDKKVVKMHVDQVQHLVLNLLPDA